MTPLDNSVFVYKGGNQKVPKNIFRATIDASARIIPSMAFKGCKLLTHVSFQNGLEEIQSFAFLDCVSLVEIKLAKTTKIVRCGAFANCVAARFVSLNEGLMELHTSSFKGCSMVQYLCLPSTLELLGKWAFAECQNLKEVAIHEGLTKIDDWVFEHCNNLQVIGIPNSVKIIGRKAIPNTCLIQERENAGIVWQHVFHCIEELERLDRPQEGASEEGAAATALLPTNAAAATTSSSTYDLAAAKKEIQGLNTDILEILDSNRKLQARTAMLSKGHESLKSDLNAMKRQHDATVEELWQASQDRDDLKQQVAAMQECLYVLKDGVELLAKQQSLQKTTDVLPPMMIGVEETSSSSSSLDTPTTKKRSRSECDETLQQVDSNVMGGIKRIFRGIIPWSAEPKAKKQDIGVGKKEDL
ncbi:unnamed protein product [Cylindrotheca closterium]|uniref:Uncharacterized protein n=1 Tax=Cylindrotheca closterium TaxID=2856 RepID=A0AAD2FNH5_9STRA|nr:unnamed protein product [Cylindrotheca closterium]